MLQAEQAVVDVQVEQPVEHDVQVLMAAVLALAKVPAGQEVTHDVPPTLRYPVLHAVHTVALE